MKTIPVLTFILLTIAFLGLSQLLAQPALPSNPDQTPIDGGLALLALGGGLYAWRKLRVNKDHS